MASIAWHVGIAAILIAVPAGIALLVHRYVQALRRRRGLAVVLYPLAIAGAVLYWVLLLALVFYPGFGGPNPITQTLAIEAFVVVALPVGAAALFRWARRRQTPQA